MEMEEKIQKSEVAVDIKETADNNQTNCNVNVQDEKNFGGKPLHSVDKKLLDSFKVIDENRLKIIFTKRMNVYIFAVICMFMWASAYPTIRLGYEEFHVDKKNLRACFLFAGIRFTISGVLILGGYFVAKKKIVLPKRRMLPDILALGIVTVTIQYIVFYAGVGHTTGVKNSVINSCSTFFSVIMAHFLFKNDRITVRKAIGCLVGFAGVIIINVGFDFFFGNAEKLEFGFTFRGEGFMILNCFISSVGNVLVKIINNTGSLFKPLKYPKEERGKKKIDIILITGWQMLIGSVILDIISLIWIKLDPLEPEEGSNIIPYTNISALGYILMFHMGLIAAVAFPIWNTLLKFNNVGKISFFNFLIPVFGTFLSGLLLGENLFKIENLVSLIMVCIGVIIVC